MKKHYLLAFLAIIFLIGCKPNEVIIERTTFKDRLQIDTFIVQQKDSVFIRQKGDTVTIEKFKTLFRERIKIQKDTVNVQKVDTIVKTVKVEKIVEKQNTGFFFWFGVVSVVVLIGWLILKLKKIFMF